MIAITKTVRFSAAHRYWRPEWSEERNRKSFGRCVDMHGHNYLLEVTICGIPDSQTGMIIDLKEVKQILNQRILDRLDHRYLNETVPLFRQQVPTTENLVLFIRDELRDAFSGARLHRVRLWEDVDLYAEWEDDTQC